MNKPHTTPAKEYGTQEASLSTTAPEEVRYVSAQEGTDELHNELRLLFREIIDATQRLQPGNVAHQKAGVMSVAMYGLDLLNGNV